MQSGAHNWEQVHTSGTRDARRVKLQILNLAVTYSFAPL